LNLFCRKHARDDHRYIVEFYSAMESIQCSFSMWSAITGHSRWLQRWSRLTFNASMPIRSFIAMPFIFLLQLPPTLVGLYKPTFVTLSVSSINICNKFYYSFLRSDANRFVLLHYNLFTSFPLLA
jgi:hypothetical protein